MSGNYTWLGWQRELSFFKHFNNYDLKSLLGTLTHKKQVIKKRLKDVAPSYYKRCNDIQDYIALTKKIKLIKNIEKLRAFE